MHTWTITVPCLPTEVNSQQLQLKITWFRANLIILVKIHWIFQDLHQRIFVYPLKAFWSRCFSLKTQLDHFPKTIKSDCLSHTIFMISEICYPCFLTNFLTFSSCVNTFQEPVAVFNCVQNALGALDECRSCLCTIMFVFGVPCPQT